tara:strand:- start:3389 stop:3871 length:483 start_codon:yes stop_codon:yes gene_type:complete
MDINQILNFGLGIGAIFAMALQKHVVAYILFSVLLGWVILSNFVGGESGSFDFSKIAFLGFSSILFFTVVYLVMLTKKHSFIFENAPPGDLEFYLKSTNTLIVFVFLIINGASSLEKQMESMFPNCGNLILMLVLFLFTYLLGIMVVNISIIVNKKITDG